MKLSNQLIDVAQTEAEKRAIYEFRYQVYIEEMGKPYSMNYPERSSTQSNGTTSVRELPTAKR
jgi:hypothetical protein